MEKGLKGRNIVIGVTGSIACYKALDLIKEFRKKGANVYVIMTYGASQLVPVRDFETVDILEEYKYDYMVDLIDQMQ